MVNEWTRDDLPSIQGLLDSWSGHGGLWALAVHVRDSVVDHLNTNGGVPVSRGDAALADHLGRQAVAIDELQLDLEAAEADRDRWRRAHEIVERERDEARDERDKWEGKYLDTDESLHQARASLHEACKVAQSYKVDAYQATERAEAAERELDEWRARAEAAEARTTPAVSRADVAEALSRCINPEMWNVTFPSVVSEVCDLFGVEAEQAADPAVHVVRESDVAAVEVRRASDGWHADGAWLASADETAEWVRDRATEMVVCAARNEAVARAIEAEQATDPLLDKAQEFAALADWELTDREAGLLHAVAAHVLGQEAKR